MNAYERALAALGSSGGDPLALAREAVREAPGFAPARILEASLLLCSRDVRDFHAARRTHEALRPLAMTSRDAAHERAIAAAIDGNYPRACRIYDELLGHEPGDLPALVVAQVYDYFLGNAARLRERAARVRAAWTADMPGYHSVLSLHAFALQECGDYDEARDAASEALDLDPGDVRAYHAIAHVLEMQGRAEEGVRWLGQHSARWTRPGAAATHLWWHVALYHLQLDQPGRALLAYDRRIDGPSAALGALAEKIDAAALLWRLELAGHDTGGRLRALAERWAPHAEDAYCAFNDMHAMMAFAGAGRWDLARRLLGAQERRLAGSWGANHDMTRLVGYPACRALLAFGREDYGAAEALLRALPPVAHRIGGSHAQRDVLNLTRAAAAARRARRPAVLAA